MRKATCVTVAGASICTTLTDLLPCLYELDSVISEGTATGADLDCVFRALNYLKRYKASNPRIAQVIRLAEKILVKDLRDGLISVW